MGGSAAILEIRVKVVKQQAMRDLQQLNAVVAQSAATGGRAPSSTGWNNFFTSLNNGAGKAVDGLGKLWNAFGTNSQRALDFGKNLQWTGRQLEFTFSLPLLLAGGLATKWALANEAAMTKVRKVYGDGTESAAQLEGELTALDHTFELLSNRFGVARTDVIAIGEAWAQAGSAGVGLAKNTQNTLEFMIISGMKWEESVKSLIAVQGAYGLSSEQMAEQIAYMNAIENQTAIDMGGLIDVLTRSGGAARNAGIDIRHLSAMAAALVPIAGDASKAGNSLQTIISRLFAPTKDATEALRLMGINTADSTWQMANGTERIEQVAKAMGNLTHGQEDLLASALGSRRQFNELLTLSNDINRSFDESTRASSYYAKALDATGSAAQAQATYQKELQTYLSSNPQKVQILTTMLKNYAADAIIPLLPALIGLLQRLVNLAQAFADLDPQTQQTIMSFLLFLAVLGPVTRITGGLFQLFGLLGKMIHYVGTEVFHFVGFMGNALSSIATFIVQSTASIGTVIGHVWTEIVWAAGDAAAAISTIWTSFATFMATLWGNIVTTATAAWGAFTTFMAQLWTEIVWLAADIWAAIPVVVDGVATAVGAIWAGLPLFLSHLWTEMVWAYQAAQEAIMALTVWVQTGVVALWEGLQAAYVAISTALPAIWAAAQTAIMTVTVWAQTGIAALWEALQAAYVALGTALPVIWAAAQEAVLGVSVTTQTFMIGLWEALPGVWAAISGAITAIWAALPAIWGGFMLAIDGITAAAGAAISAAFAAGLVWPIVAAIAAAIAVVIIAVNTGLVDKIVEAVQYIADGFGKLPQVVADVFMNILKIVQKIMEQVIDWISYLNPFQKHSPSLVENVTKGVSVILGQYSRLRNIGGMLSSAAAAHKAFSDAIGGPMGVMEGSQNAKKRDKVAAQAPGALGAYDNMRAQLAQLESILPDIEAAVRGQKQVVDNWDAALKSANADLDDQEAILSRLKDQLSAVEARMNAARDAIDHYSKVGIVGMRAFDDQIFANEMAQKKLRLEILKLEQAGQSIDDIKNKMAALQGEIEGLRSTREDLRLAGAGSDVLKGIDDQIAALEKQQKTMAAVGAPIDELQKKLDELKRQAEMLDLEKSINFDPQLRQIDQLVNGLEELPFDVIVSKIKEQQAQLAALEPIHQAITDKITAQMAVVDQYKAKRDEIQATYDLEKAKLDSLSDTYDRIKQQISDMKSLMDQFTSSLEAAASVKGPSDLEKQFQQASQANFDIPGGTSAIGREGNQFDIEEFNRQLEETIKKSMGGMENLDPFKPLKDKWFEFTAWMSDAWNRGWAFVHDIPGLGVINPFAFFITHWNEIASALSTSWENIKGWWETFTGFLSSTWDTFTQGLYAIWVSVGEPLLRLISDTWTNTVQPAIQAFVDFFVGVWNNVLWPVIDVFWNNILKPFIDWIVNAFQSYVMPILQLFGAVWQIIFAVVGAVFGAVVTVIVWGVTHLGDIFMWLWEHVIQPVWDGIQNASRFLWDNVLHPIFDAIGWALDKLGGAFSWLWEHAISPVWDAISAGASWLWNTVLSPVFDWIGSGVDQLGKVFNWLKDSVIDPVFGSIQTIIAGAWDGIASGIEKFVNFFVGAFNLLAKGVRAAAGFLKVDVHIDDMPEIHLPRINQHAMGTDAIASTVGKGFMTNGIRAIVGEGNPLWAEYVVPTDPAYRNNALALWRKLGHDLAVPGFYSGGVMGSDTGWMPPSDASSSSSGERHIHLHGDIVLPNITNGNDAHEFLDNLASLVE